MAKRLTRKKLKQKDEFITTAEKLLNAARKRKSYLVIAGIVVFFLLIFGSIGFYYYKDYLRRGSIQYSQALQLYELASRTHDKNDITNALNAFETLITNFRFLNISKLAMLYAGSCEYMLGNYDKAIQDYRTFISKWGDKNVYILSIAYNGIIQADIAKNDCNSALNVITDLLKQKDNPFVELTYVHGVDCYIKMNNPEKAIEFLDTAIKNNSNNKDLVSQLTNILNYVKENYTR
ncbi:MAG: tetratricopeptide repeat protein [bacterium]